MEIDVDWVYREFLRRGYKPEYATDFLDQAWKNSAKGAERLRTAPDVYPVPDACADVEVKAVALLRAWVAGCGDEIFSTKEECRELLQSSGDFLATLPPY